MRLNELNEKHVKELSDLSNIAWDIADAGFKWVYDKVTGKKKKVRKK